MSGLLHDCSFKLFDGLKFVKPLLLTVITPIFELLLFKPFIKPKIKFKKLIKLKPSLKLFEPISNNVVEPLAKDDGIIVVDV